MTSDDRIAMRCRAGSPGLRLAQAVDSQFDTSVVAAFEAVLAMATEPYRMHPRRNSLPSGNGTELS